MANPQFLQHIRHGKFLTRENFPTFVETFNWLVDFCANLKGDADLAGGAWNPDGVTLDRTRSDRPILRLKNGGSRDFDSSRFGCWRIVGKEGGEHTFEDTFLHVGSGFYPVTGFDYTVEQIVNQAQGEGDTVYFGVQIEYPGEQGEIDSASVVSETSLAEFALKTKDTDHCVIPLYAFNRDGSVKTDFRNLPGAQMFEYLPEDEEE